MSSFFKTALFASLAGHAAAFLATFEAPSANLNNIGNATFTDFNIVAPGGSVTTIPQSPTHLIQSNTPPNAPNVPANGTMLLNNANNHVSYGHWSSYYLGCYSPAAFGNGSSSCNFTMTANCYTLQNNINVFTLKQQYTRSDRKMDLIDLTGFYQYYAGLGYFPGNGSTAACTRYDFHSINNLAGSVPVGFYLDDITFTVHS